MPKIGQQGPTVYGSEGAVTDAQGNVYQVDPTADVSAGEDYRGTEVRPKATDDMTDEQRAEWERTNRQDGTYADRLAVDDEDKGDNLTGAKGGDGSSDGENSKASSQPRGKTSKTSGAQGR